MRTLDQPVAPRAPGTPVAWHDDLSALRAAVGSGAAVGIGQAGVVVDRVGFGRVVFATIDDALDHFTTPTARAG